jgi:hypothetical protein
MTATDRREPDDRMLASYLLGMLPAAEAERLDEMSVTDDDFVLRLSAAENDLVDAYVRGDLDADSMERFRATYMASPLRLEKVDFARTLYVLDQRSAPIAAASAGRALGKSFWQRFVAPRLLPVWGLAAVALAAVALYVTIENGRLRTALNSTQSEKAVLSREVDLQRSAAAKAQKELEQARTSQANLDGYKAVALLLMPATRGVGRLPTISVPSGTDLVVLSLGLESADFKSYRAELKDRSRQQVLWQSGRLQPTSQAGGEFVSITFPARLLGSENYVVELTGLRANDAAVLAGNYVFRATVK